MINKKAVYKKFEHMFEVLYSAKVAVTNLMLFFVTMHISTDWTLSHSGRTDSVSETFNIL